MLDSIRSTEKINDSECDVYYNWKGIAPHTLNTIGTDMRRFVVSKIDTTCDWNVYNMVRTNKTNIFYIIHYI